MTDYFDIINFILGSLALIAAIYAIVYTHRFNRRKVIINDCWFYTTEENPPIAWFEVTNLSPVPITLTNVIFFDVDKNKLKPLIDYDPNPTYSIVETSFMPEEIRNTPSKYSYSFHIDRLTVLQPYSSMEFGYYFKNTYSKMNIKLFSIERIYCFKKHQSFICDFVQVKD